MKRQNATFYVILQIVNAILLRARMVKALYQVEGLSQELAAFYSRLHPKQPHVRESSPPSHSADCLLSEGHAEMTG